MKEYEEFIQDYEDSNKHIKLFIDISDTSNIEYQSKDIELGDVKVAEKNIPVIQQFKKLNKKKKDKIF
ncbi:hypothetical protein [uncultured Methanobrevibacter sp.]|uniref:hypothetical protein n=1 Tax=uncultured Methanobrevibacter sp. TaxID=253161 RepID=UPI0025E631FE|nr:hypothetical protein [uncultured Methanobrevibacter sp.]MBR4591146.1 hypothetical protein [Bacteroidaceae bacterium]